MFQYKNQVLIQCCISGFRRRFGLAAKGYTCTRRVECGVATYGNFIRMGRKRAHFCILPVSIWEWSHSEQNVQCSSCDSCSTYDYFLLVCLQDEDNKADNMGTPIEDISNNGLQLRAGKEDLLISWLFPNCIGDGALDTPANSESLFQVYS